MLAEHDNKQDYNNVYKGQDVPLARVDKFVNGEELKAEDEQEDINQYNIQKAALDAVDNIGNNKRQYVKAIRKKVDKAPPLTQEEAKGVTRSYKTLMKTVTDKKAIKTLVAQDIADKRRLKKESKQSVRARVTQLQIESLDMGKMVALQEKLTSEYPTLLERMMNATTLTSAQNKDAKVKEKLNKLQGRIRDLTSEDNQMTMATFERNIKSVEQVMAELGNVKNDLLNMNTEYRDSLYVTKQTSKMIN